MPAIRVAVLAAAEWVRAGLEAQLESQPDLRVVSMDAARTGSRPAFDVLVVAEGRDLRAGGRSTPDGPSAPGGLAETVGAGASGYAGAPAVVCLSDDPDAAARLAAAGPPAWALLGPGAGRAQLAAAVRAVHRGLVVLGPPLAPGWFPSRPAGEGPRLTPREREVLALLARGLGNKQIAWELGVSEHTVKYHVSSLYAKLGAGSRTEALRLGIERGLLSV
jgi:two-component system nitrate/nitrite response regulator NarL